jgi:hypothetical protein
MNHPHRSGPIEAQTSSPVQPATRWMPRGTPQPGSRSPERSFEVESRGGYARTVVGRVAYLDDEAQTYMVLTRDGCSSGFRCEISRARTAFRRPHRSRRSAAADISGRG